MYRGRLAPSPTGLVHMGTARTALIAWLSARAVQGQLVMRVEDLDGPRVVPGSADAILRDLQWLGIDWDEGPFYQSERSHLYAAAIEQLRAIGLVYPCTCSRKEIAAIASAPHEDDLEPRYPGTCRDHVSHTDGRTPSVRFRMPDQQARFVDRLHGEQGGGQGGDFVVHRADGVYAYQLAVVVDDIAMGITEVVRGDDLLSSTPRQIALYRALGAEPPTFFHVPLLLADDGVRLAKRHGALTIAQLRDQGISSDQIIGRLAHTLGLIDRDAPISIRELIPHFDVSRLPRAASPITTTWACSP